MNAANQSCQPRPGGCLVEGRAPSARPACTHRSAMKRDDRSPACHRRQQRQQSPEASSVSSVTSCATDAAVPHHVPGGAASDHPCPLRDPWSSPRHGVIPFLTKSNQPLAALISPVVSGHRGSALGVRSGVTARCQGVEAWLTGGLPRRKVPEEAAPEWHLQILEDRERRLAAGQEEVLDWEEAKRRLRQEIHEGQDS